VKSVTSYFCLVIAFLFVIIPSHVSAQIPSFLTHIPSEGGGDEGIAVKIIPPPMQRYENGSPVVVYVQGGVNGAGLSQRGVNLGLKGFIEIRFNFPGSGVAEDKSGGIYDQRGPECLKALRDVIRFALGELADEDGNFLADIIQPIQPLASNVGLIGFSHGGNSAISVAGVHGAEISSLAWIVNYESPVGDGMPTAEAGSRGSSCNPSVNPAYDPDTGEFDLSLLAYDDTVSINQSHVFMGLGELHGGFYFDVNQNGIVDIGTDFIAAPFLYEINDTLKAFYSVRIMEEAERRNLIPDNPPSHISTLEQTREYWYWRNGENWFEQAIQNIPHLMFIVEASETDHVQSAPDHPHVLIQYEGFRSAGARFVRLNPDRAYVEYILRDSAPTAADNDAFAVFDHQTIRTALEPPRQGGFPINITVAAAACELADRTQFNDVSPQIDNIITSVEKSENLISDFKLFPVFPNPFNSQTVISFQLPGESHVKLDIFNELGQKVKSLINSTEEQGHNFIIWDGKDDLGYTVSSGVYFYKLILNDNFGKVNKLMLIK